MPNEDPFLQAFARICAAANIECDLNKDYSGFHVTKAQLCKMAIEVEKMLTEKAIMDFEAIAAYAKKQADANKTILTLLNMELK
jgi:hypothetical protein